MSIRDSKEEFVKISGFPLGYPRSRYHSLSVKRWIPELKSPSVEIGLLRSTAGKRGKWRHKVKNRFWKFVPSFFSRHF